MKKLLATAIPILPGKTAQWKKFIDQLNTTYYAQFSESRKQLKVRERTFFQSTPQGDFVLVTLEGDDPAKAFANFATGNDKFTQWFVNEVKEIHGFDLKSPPKGAMPEMVIDSMESIMQN